MAAGLGFKTFTTGEVLTAGDTNGYLMQGVLVFADAAARSAAITSPQEGQVSYLKSDDGIYTYSGSAWISAGLPSQTGNASKYLTTDGTTPSWGAVSADKTIAQIASGTTTSGTSLSLTSLTSYDTLKLRVNAVTTSASAQLSFTINSNTGAIYDYMSWTPASTNTSSFDGNEFQRSRRQTSDVQFNISGLDTFASNTVNWFDITLTNCKGTGFTYFEMQGYYSVFYAATYKSMPIATGIFKSAATVSSIQFNTSSAFTAGDYVLWGG